MARGTTSADVLLMLKKELGYDTATGVTTADTELYGLLSDTQQWLWAQYQWPFLFLREDDSLTASTRYYANPTTISMDFPVRTEVYMNGLWYPVDYGISGEQYNLVDSDANETRDPVERWQDYSTTQYEVWPVPSTAQTLRFWGYATVAKFTGSGTIVVLDDLLIVLYAAAEKLARSKMADATMKLQKAQALFHRLKGAKRQDTVFTLGGSDPLEYQRPDKRHIVTVRSAS